MTVLLYTCTFFLGRPKSMHRQFSQDQPENFRQRTISSCSRGSQGSPRSPRSKTNLLHQMSVMSNRTISIEDDHEPKGQYIYKKELLKWL
jgi:hypothetical protein